MAACSPFHSFHNSFILVVISLNSDMDNMFVISFFEKSNKNTNKNYRISPYDGFYTEGLFGDARMIGHDNCARDNWAPFFFATIGHHLIN